jgi:hypothetical protein
MLALTRPGAKAAVLMHAVLPLHFFGAQQWPEAVPAQIHFSEDDPWVDSAVADKVGGGVAQLFRYSGGAHLFADQASEDFDADHAQQMLVRVRAFVK